MSRERQTLWRKIVARLSQSIRSMDAYLLWDNNKILREENCGKRNKIVVWLVVLLISRGGWLPVDRKYDRQTDSYLVDISLRSPGRGLSDRRPRHRAWYR